MMGLPAVVLAYHDVVARNAAGLSVTADALRAQIRMLRRFGLRIVPLHELVRRVRAGLVTDGLASLSFDDGLVGVHRHALDVLAAERAPATVFAVSGASGVEPPWWPGSARTMTRVELKEVVAAGHTVEAHTRSHRSLPGLNDAELELELRRCRAELQNAVDGDVSALAYPYGHHDRRVRAAAHAAGYHVAFTFLNGRITGVEDGFRLPRFTMTAAHSRARLGYHLVRPARTWPPHQQDEITGPVGS